MVFFVVLFVSAPAAGAQDGYEGSGTLTCTPTTVQAGQQVSCTVTGCNTGSTATFSLNGNQVGTAVAASPATVSFVVPPGTQPGSLQVTATCDGLSSVLTTNLTVVASGGSPGTSGSGALPATGSNSVSWVQIAVALIVVGGLLVLASRKRRQVRTVSA